MRRRGKSVIELVVVLGIVALMIGLALPAVLGTRQAGDRVAEENAAYQRRLEEQMRP